MFNSIPVFGSQDFKCLCKHSHLDHDPNGKRKCINNKSCKNGCNGFTSSHHCGCGMTYDEHHTVFQSRAEREAEGRPVDPSWMQEQNMVGGMGGLGNDFMGLVHESNKQDLMN